LGSPVAMTAWKATAMPSQPGRSCGSARARLVESTVSAPVVATCTPERWSAWRSLAGDAVTTWLGPPASAGAASSTARVVTSASSRRMSSGLPEPHNEQTAPSARREGRLFEHLAEAALEVVGRDADVA